MAFVSGIEPSRHFSTEVVASRVGEPHSAARVFRFRPEVPRARVVRDPMRLCLPMARRYPPYRKWRGGASALARPRAGPPGG
jgi:hypothetical protein